MSKKNSTPSTSQIAANRANAKASTGPRTTTGKAAASKNATTHGLTSKRLVLRTEDAEEYAIFRTGFEKALAPKGEQEICAFEEYVTSLWRQQRCRRTEAAVLDDCIETLMDQDGELTPDQALARVFITPEYQKKMSLFLRYQSSIERAVNRAWKELTTLQNLRREAEMMAALAPRANAAGRAFEIPEPTETEPAFSPIPYNHAIPPAEPLGFVSQL